jgi:hypothetical protein
MCPKRIFTPQNADRFLAGLSALNDANEFFVWVSHNIYTGKPCSDVFNPALREVSDANAYAKMTVISISWLDSACWSAYILGRQ